MAKRRRSGPTMIQNSRRKSAEMKAIHHNITGAGKAHVKREFMGLSDEDERVILARLEEAIGRRLEKL